MTWMLLLTVMAADDVDVATDGNVMAADDVDVATDGNGC